MSDVDENPSSWLRSSNMVRWTSESPPPLPDSIRDEPIESISSIKIIEGACSLQGKSSKRFLISKKASNKGITIWLIPLPSHNEQLSDHPRSFTDELLHQFRARDSDEGTFSVMGDCTGQQSLASSWKPKFLVKNTIYYCLPFHKKGWSCNYK